MTKFSLLWGSANNKNDNNNNMGGPITFYFYFSNLPVLTISSMQTTVSLS